MDDKEHEEKIRAMSFSSGKNTMSIDDMATIQPGLARIMPEIGARTWKLFYAAKLQNWPMAKFQYKEIIGLFELLVVHGSSLLPGSCVGPGLHSEVVPAAPQGDR